MSTGDGKRSRFPPLLLLLLSLHARDSFLSSPPPPPSRFCSARVHRRADHRVKAKGIRVKRILLPLINGNRGRLKKRGSNVSTRKFRRIESVVKRVFFLANGTNACVRNCVRKGRMARIKIFEDTVINICDLVINKNLFYHRDTI